MKAFNWSQWPVFARLRKAEQIPPHPGAENEGWVCYISAGGSHHAIACHACSRQDALALRKYILDNLPQRVKEQR